MSASVAYLFTRATLLQLLPPPVVLLLPPGLPLRTIAWTVSSELLD